MTVQLSNLSRDWQCPIKEEDGKINLEGIFLTLAAFAAIILPALFLIKKLYLFNSNQIKLTRREIQLIENAIQLHSNEIPDPEITKLQGRNFTFRHLKIPNLVFKVCATPDKTKSRFDNMVIARQICNEHKLDLLIIPKATLIECRLKGKAHKVIAEERFPINPTTSTQEELYRQSDRIDKAVMQLFFFIVKTGLSDVEPRNIPILDDRIVLLDLEDMWGPSIGIYGLWKNIADPNPVGLIGCLSSRAQIEKVIRIAESHNIYPLAHAPISYIKSRRLEELKRAANYTKFHEDLGLIENPRRKFPKLTPTSLGLEVARGLERPLNSLIELLNGHITNCSEEESTKGKRTISLAIPCAAYLQVVQIATALKEHRYIFDFQKTGFHPTQLKPFYQILIQA